MKKFAYLTGKGILHIVKDKKTAEESAKLNGRVVETEFPARHGYPFVGGDEIIVYSETDMRLEANGAPLDAEKHRDLAELYRLCR